MNMAWEERTNSVRSNLWTTARASGEQGYASRPKVSLRRGTRRGTAVVELAVTSPLLCLLALGVVEYAQFTNTAKIIGDASRRGALFAAREDTTSVAQVQSHVREFVTGALANLPDGTAVNVQVIHGSGAPLTSGDLSEIGSGSSVMVDVSMDFSSVRWLNYFTNLNGKSLSVSTIARRE